MATSCSTGSWRLFGAIEGANGLLLFGWSTAFLFSVNGAAARLEHDWLERSKSDRADQARTADLAARRLDVRCL